MAPRQPLRALYRFARGAGLIACLCLASQGAAQEFITGALFRGETDVYAHCILGDCLEWDTLEVVVEKDDGSLETRQFQAGSGFVFEYVRPDFMDIDGDGRFEVAVVLTSTTLGGALAIYGPDGLIAKTPHIGRSNRWLAPIGAADFDRDGRVEIAFIDRPHLAKTLRVFEWTGSELVLQTEIGGLTNHRIGEDFISSGVRDCGAGPQMVTADADWSDIMVTSYDGGWVTRSVGAFSPARLAAELDCQRS
jgi:hypothetical protein